MRACWYVGRKSGVSVWLSQGDQWQMKKMRSEKQREARPYSCFVGLLRTLALHAGSRDPWEDCEPKVLWPDFKLISLSSVLVTDSRGTKTEIGKPVRKPLYSDPRSRKETDKVTLHVFWDLSQHDFPTASVCERRKGSRLNCRVLQF